MNNFYIRYSLRRISYAIISTWLPSEAIHYAAVVELAEGVCLESRRAERLRGFKSLLLRFLFTGILYNYTVAKTAHIHFKGYGPFLFYLYSRNEGKSKYLPSDCVITKKRRLSEYLCYHSKSQQI